MVMRVKQRVLQTELYEQFAERSAMDDVRRALKQKKQLTEKFKHREDKAEWEKRLKEINDSADKKSWTHAAALLERLTSDLDKKVKQAKMLKNYLTLLMKSGKSLEINARQRSSKLMTKRDVIAKKQFLKQRSI